MEKRSVALLFLFLLCFPFTSDSQTLNPSTSLRKQEQEQVHEVTIKDINIFRAGNGGRGVSGGRGGGRKASPKRNASVENRPPFFFSVVSVLLSGFLMFSLTSFDMSI